MVRDERQKSARAVGYLKRCCLVLGNIKRCDALAVHVPCAQVSHLPINPKTVLHLEIVPDHGDVLSLNVPIRAWDCPPSGPMRQNWGFR
jgi:hypothetical protein